MPAYRRYTEAERDTIRREVQAARLRERNRELLQLAVSFGVPFPAEPLDIPSHGVSGYSNRGCRCPTCLEAGRQYARDRRARR